MNNNGVHDTAAIKRIERISACLVVAKNHMDKPLKTLIISWVDFLEELYIPSTADRS